MLSDVINYTLTATMVGVAAAWIFLIKSMMMSFRHTPYLDRFDGKTHQNPMVSVIVPARNEEKWIKRCLDSLSSQDYPNYEIVVIDDSSYDKTSEIIEKCAVANGNIVPVKARPKPEGWMGKNWACMEGFRKATGQLLLFTDADTKHAPNVISLAVSHLLSLDLDALSVIPKMRVLDWWTGITLPMISIFLHTRFSALNVNDPSKKTGYFFGSFFIIREETYRQAGMHEGVRHEIIEDGALGRKVKDSGSKMRMVRGEHLIDAVWARDRRTLWNALKRLIVPLYLQSSRITVGIFAAVLFLLVMPFPILAYSSIMIHEMSGAVLFFAALVASALIYLGGIIEVSRGLSLGYSHAVFSPIGGTVVVLGFLSGIFQAKSENSVSWRGRDYSMKDHAQSSVGI